MEDSNLKRRKFPVTIRRTCLKAEKRKLDYHKCNHLAQASDTTQWHGGMGKHSNHVQNLARGTGESLPQDNTTIIKINEGHKFCSTNITTTESPK